MKRRHCRCEARTKNTSPIPRIVPFAPNVDFLAVDQVCRAAEKAGWPSRSAFECAVFFRMHGTTASEAAAMFDQCDLWVQ